MPQLNGHRALITGVTGGIGDALARQFISDGAEVIGTGSRPDWSAVPGVQYERVDFHDRSATEQFAARLSGLDVDILVNCAGINAVGPFAEINPADFDRVIEVNLRVPFLLCRAVLPAMYRRGWGRIVNIGSVFGKVAKEGRGPYSASKFGLDGMTAALAAEVAPLGVLANTVSPGFIDTNLTRRVLGDTGIAEMTRKVPMGRLGTPEEVAVLVAWLASPNNTFISGQNIAIDGGFTRV